MQVRAAAADVGMLLAAAVEQAANTTVAAAPGSVDATIGGNPMCMLCSCTQNCMIHGLALCTSLLLIKCMVFQLGCKELRFQNASVRNMLADVLCLLSAGAIVGG